MTFVRSWTRSASGRRSSSGTAARDAEGLVRLGLATWAPAGHDDEARSQIASAVSTFLADCDLELQPPPGYPRLAEIRAPAVIVRGDREYPMVADCSEAIAERIPGSRRLVIPGADHMLWATGIPENLSTISLMRRRTVAAGHS